MNKISFLVLGAIATVALVAWPVGPMDVLRSRCRVGSGRIMVWSFRVTASGDRGSFPGEIAELNLPKQRVAGSSPVSRSRYDF